jgi:D-3-phosphoglycerate dehydrogenase
MYKILITDKLPESALKILSDDQRYEVTVETGLSEQQICNVIPGYHGLLVRSATTVTANIINAAENLKVIGRAGTGLDNIDVKYATGRGIEVQNTPGSNSRAVAELTIALIFSLSRQIVRATSSLKAHRWDKSILTGIELESKILGLIGFGKIGQEVGKLAASLGMTILVYKPNPLKKSPGYEYELVTLDHLLAKSDYISLHLPKTDKSKNMISSAEFKKMKTSAFLINCARGGIVNEDDLLRALDKRQIAGAALDVFETEPPANFKLIDHENVICTPHIGAATHESQERVGKDIVTSVKNYLEKNYMFITSKV